jgi:hypothetical protein
LDTLIALSEPRKYNGGQHSPWEILRIVSKFPKHKAEPCQELIQAMRRIAPPELGLIQNLTDFPNIGLDPRVYYQIQNRMNEAVARIRKEGYEL